MKLRGYIALGLAVLTAALLIAGIVSGRFKNDFADIRPIVWLGVAPSVVLMFSWHRSMKAAARIEFEATPRVLGQRTSFSPEFVSTWTVRAAVYGAAAICLMFVIVLLPSPPERGEQWLAVVAAALFGAFCGAIGATIRAGRVIGYVEADLNNQRDDIFTGAA